MTRALAFSDPIVTYRESLRTHTADLMAISSCPHCRTTTHASNRRKVLGHKKESRCSDEGSAATRKKIRGITETAQEAQ